jgi:protein-disulfide isomerase
MAKGKKPTQPQAKPWIRWGGVLVGLALAAAVVWFVAKPSEGDSAIDDTEQAAGPGPRPLDLAADGPTVANAAALADAPPESLASAGPAVPNGIDISNDPRIGDDNARVTIVEFSDFECSHCARFHEEIFPALRSLYGDQIRWVFVNTFFSAGHPMAESAALASECANRQGRFWQYAELVFAHQAELSRETLDGHAQSLGLDLVAFRQCFDNREMASEVAADLAEGDRVGVNATPTFFVNGRKITGAQPVAVFNDLLAPYFAN